MWRPFQVEYVHICGIFIRKMSCDWSNELLLLLIITNHILKAARYYGDKYYLQRATTSNLSASYLSCFSILNTCIVPSI